MKLDADHQSATPLAFSLIEVVIALAIFSTGVIVLVGMLPQNLDRMREASSHSIERRIAQNLIGELMLNEWESLHQFDATKSGARRYFDGQGIEQSGFNDDTIFVARIRVLPRDVNIDQNRSLESVPVSSKNVHRLPDDSEVNQSTSQHARRLIVEVTDVPDPEFDFDNPDHLRLFLRVGTVVSNLSDTAALTDEI